MAKLWYLKGSRGPERLRSGHEITVDLLLSEITHRDVKYVGPAPPTTPAAGEDLTPYRSPSHVLVGVSSRELKDVFGKPGYYLLLGVQSEEAEKWV